ncbi:cell division protein PerM [Microbacterium sp. F1-18]
MNRLLVALLSAFDALVAVAVGVAAALAPLTVLWAVGFGGGADWSSLWPASVRLWQFGNLVPLQVSLPQEYTVAAGIAPDALTFSLSLPPLAVALLIALFAARSGARAAGAGAGFTGVLAGTATVAVASALVAATASTPYAVVETWQAVLLPTLVFAVPALLGSVARAWRDGDDGPVDSLFVRLDRSGYATAVSAGARGLAIAVVGFAGVGALLVGVAVLVRGGEIVSLFQAANVDAIGATAVTIGQAAYLPTFFVWGGAFAAGPGFSLGAGSTVAASGTQLGVVPGIPVLGAIPPATPPVLLLVALLLVALGFIAGSAARRRMPAPASALVADPVLPRLAAAAIVAVGGGLAVAVLSLLASGAFGPGRLDQIGPSAGAVGLAFAVEIGIGATIALLGPRTARHADAAAERSTAGDDDQARLAGTARVE